MRKRILAAALAVALCLSCAACGGTTPIPASSAAETQPAAPAETAAPSAALQEEALFSDRDYRTGYSDAAEIRLADGASQADSSGVTIAGDTVTITQEGVYRLTGALSNGQIVVDAAKDAKVQLVLDGVSVTRTGSAALYLKQADKLFLTTAAGSENTLRSVGEFVQTDENNVDGAIFAKDDLTLNGEGTLYVSCETAHGIVGKDDLKLTSGTYQVTAAKKGLEGKDSVCIAGGDLTVTSGADAIHAENSDDAEKGYLYIGGGIITLDSGKHGLSAESVLVIRGGSFVLDAVQDALHSDGDMEISGGSFAVRAGDDGLHADGALLLSGSTLDIRESYEGIEAAQLTVSGGVITVNASDDGLNAADGAAGSGTAGPWGKDSFSSGTDVSIVISGGELTVNAGGDGIDSNGALYVQGGTIYVSGPTSGADSALDYETVGTITGGVVVAAGAAGMAQNFGSDSTQGSILWSLPSPQAAGTEITLTDSEGTVLARYTPEKAYQSVVLSAPGLAEGGSYTLAAGDTSETITLSSLIYGSGMGGGRMGGRGGRMELPQQPDGALPDGEAPDDAPGQKFDGEMPDDMPDQKSGGQMRPDDAEDRPMRGRTDGTQPGGEKGTLPDILAGSADGIKT